MYHGIRRAPNQGKHRRKGDRLFTKSCVIVAMALAVSNVPVIHTEKPTLPIAIHEATIQGPVVSEPRSEPLSRATRSVSRQQPISWSPPLKKYIVSSCYGPGHVGIDLVAHRGTEIAAVGDGVVEHSGWYGNYGYSVVINHGNGWSSFYAHAAKLYPKEGMTVKSGQSVGTVGSTGRAGGPVLHFGISRVGTEQWTNPASWLRDHGVNIGC